MELIINSTLTDKLGRIDSPISKTILDLKGQEIENLPINYLGVSTTNPGYISYLDQARIDRIKNSTNLKYKVDYLLVKFKNPEQLKNIDNDFSFNLEYENAYYYYLEHRDANIFLEHNEVVNEEFIKNNILDLLLNPENYFPKDTLSSFRCKPFNYDLFLNTKTISFKGSSCIVNFGEFTHLFKEIESILEVSLTQIDTTEDNLWAPNKRYHSSVGKAIRRIIPAFEEKFNYKDLEAFVSMYKMESYKECGELGDLIYEEFKGEKLRWAYYEGNYYSLSSQLGSSCMRYSYCQKYLDLYTENPERISLAVLLKEGKVAARCLLWHDPANGEIYRDRIYAIDEDTRIILDVKLQHLYNVYNGSKDLYIPLDKTEFEFYPYVDSFQYLSYGEGVYTSCNSGYDRCMDNADGGGEEEECACCESSQDPDDLRVIDRGRYQGELWCSDCYTHTENDEYINSNDAVWCEYVKGYYHCDDVVELYNEEYALPEDTVETQEGNFYLTDDIDEYAVKYQGDWYEISGNYVVEVDGSYYHQDSNEIILLENGDYCLIENAVQVDGDWYSKDDESIQEVEGEWFVAESDEHFIALGKLKWKEMNSLLVTNEPLQIIENEKKQENQENQEIKENQQNREIEQSTITENETQTNEFIL